MLKVFLAEDEVVIREGVRKNIDWESHGYEFCGEASDGELALPLIRRLRPDIIITDIHMPFMDGLELAGLVRRELPYSEIIILTGYEKFEYAKRGIEIGVSDYLLKPVSGNDLLKAVDAAAQRIRDRQRDLELQERYSKHVVQAEQSTSSEEELDLSSVDASKIDRGRIMEFLRQGNLSDVGAFVDEFFSDIAGNAINSALFRQYIVIDAYLCASKFCSEIGQDPEKAGAGRDSAPTRAMSVSGARDYMTGLFADVISLRDSTAGSKYQDAMDKVITYIGQHYADDALSLEDVASYVGFSPNHLSSVFKTQTGLPFIKYLTDVRMSKARELLKCTSKRSSEIAELVGYRDPHYFSYLFKKTHNMTPTEYRENTVG